MLNRRDRTGQSREKPLAGPSSFPKKRLSQVFLRSERVAARIIRLAEICKGETVLEIGGGRGILTRALARSGARVTCLEVDQKLAAELRKRLSHLPEVVVLEEDALRFDFSTIPAPFKVVANLPYHISSPLLTRLLEFRTSISAMTLMVQKEVAMRLLAKPGTKEYGILSVAVQVFAETSLGFLVPGREFRPVPRVDSAVIRVKPLPVPRIPLPDPEHFFRIVRLGFGQRRKTLRNCLKQEFGEDVVDHALGDLGMDPKRRGETLSMEEFARLAAALSPSGSPLGGSDRA